MRPHAHGGRVPPATAPRKSLSDNGFSKPGASPVVSDGSLMSLSYARRGGSGVSRAIVTSHTLLRGVRQPDSDLSATNFNISVGTKMRIVGATPRRRIGSEVAV